MTSTGCQAVSRSGVACQARPVKGSAFCWSHDPALADLRAAARAAGGRARHGRTLTTGGTAVQLGTVADVVHVLAGALGDVLTLENSLGRARAVAGLCTVAVRALELSELESRVAVLEAAQNTENTGGRGHDTDTY